jgi:WxL domain surface cell wall-binding
MFKKYVVSGIAVLAALSAMAPSAFAANGSGDSTATVNGGSLSVGSVSAPNFTVNLNGTARTANGNLTFNVVDATGSGSGWRVTAVASQFSTGGQSAKTLALGSLSMAAPTIATNGGTDEGIDVMGSAHDIDAASAVTVASANNDHGMGTNAFTSQLTLSIPADAYAGSYTSSVTIDVQSGHVTVP